MAERDVRHLAERLREHRVDRLAGDEHAFPALRSIQVDPGCVVRDAVAEDVLVRVHVLQRRVDRADALIEVHHGEDHAAGLRPLLPFLPDACGDGIHERLRPRLLVRRERDLHIRQTGR